MKDMKSIDNELKKARLRFFADDGPLSVTLFLGNRFLYCVVDVMG